ncbi:Nitrogen permease regulator 2 [Actinomortierella ambigua]|uniref:Nitrogen permease regulator 2 n=1 Tax=Actinomortierella ambigua TaxID=1343610 RepID=A0A9P6QGW1_9FUNG|nr:Nitrogen permease regulator 2 [Actinomortierella ambigua]
MEFQGFPRLLSIFYCTFHPTQGPKVLYEVPEGSILSKNPLVEFDTISEFLIPKVELCSNLVTISTPSCKVLGFPINLEHKKFQRNALMFNLAFVFDKDADLSSYEPVVRKMARVLKALEKECEFLSRQTRQAMMDNGTTSTSAAIGTAASSTQSSPPLMSSATAATAPAVAGGSNCSPNTTTELSSLVATVAQIVLADQEANQQTNNGTSDGATSNQPPSSGTPAAAGSMSPALSTTSTIVAPVAGAASAPEIPSTSNSATVTATIAVQPTGLTSGSAVPSPPTSALQRNPSLPLITSQTDGNSNEQQQGTDCEGMMGMQNLIEQLLEDLNSYCECQIPVDSANTINLKLFPTYPNPATVFDYQVPIATVNLESLSDVSWDMTMQRIIGCINGVSSVKRIAEHADVDAGLVRMCMEHLLYYGCIIMVDLFQFRNIYACKMEMTRLLEDVALQNECVAYVTLQDMHAPSFARLYSLYCGLQFGQELHTWMDQNQVANYNIDVRRFISFGVIKGFLYRIHKYPILDVIPSVIAPLTSKLAPATSSAQRSPSMSPTIAHAQVPSHAEDVAQKLNSGATGTASGTATGTDSHFHLSQHSQHGHVGGTRSTTASQPAHRTSETDHPSSSANSNKLTIPTRLRA